MFTMLVFDEILKRFGQGLLDILGDEAVAQCVVAVVVAVGDGTQFVDETASSISFFVRRSDIPVIVVINA